MRETFHLVPEAIWGAADAGEPYEASTVATEGFAHCTDGVGPLGITFDRFYAGDSCAFLVLTLDLDALDSPWRYDDPDKPYPHIYGPIRRSAVLAVSRVERAADGRFVGLGPV